MAPLDTLPATADSAFDWPAFGLEDDIRPALARARALGAPAVLATLFDVVGGAPRGVGAQMLFTGAAMSGFLSGGCIEADVALHAQSVLADGAPRRLVYGDGGPADIRLACGSRIELLLERINSDDLSAGALLEETRLRRSALWLTNGQQRACVDPAKPLASPSLSPPIALGSKSLVCGHIDQPFTVFRRYSPPIRLIVIGGEPIALAVVRLALEMNIEITLIRPKGPSATPFATVRYLRGDVGPSITSLTPDPWTAVAILTHDSDLEHAALISALASSAGYIGALGSRRRIPERRNRLESDGLTAETIDRISAPIGLPIGGKSPWEIAVSILAEVVETLGQIV